MELIAIILCIVFINYTDHIKLPLKPGPYNETTAQELFLVYKDRYHKKYASNYTENNAYSNFVKNLNKVARLNRRNKEKDKLRGMHDFNLNRYADQNPQELRERYAITMRPYFYARDPEAYQKKYDRNLKRKNIEDLKLYDLDYTEDIYKAFRKRFKKVIPRFTARKISYYRFYKTLVELNNKKFRGRTVTLDSNADVVRHPYEYYFDE